ncbi:hypothetical protein BC826DRAFT_89458 [Russula brevipes]|nr:hypothetical protein BC826DRAFT_89458 [Russula brevipes]
MVGRASARVDENSRKRMKAREFQRRTGREHVRTQKSSTKGKERMGGTMFAHSMDELGGDRDHTDFVRGSHDTGVQYSSLPIMQSKNPPSQSDSTLQRADKGDVDMHVDAPVPGDGGDDRVKPPISTHPRNGSQHVPPRSTTARHSQKRAEPPSPTPARPIPTTLRPAPAPTPKPATSPTLDPPKPTPGPLRRSTRHSSSTNTNSQHPVPVSVPVRALTPLPPAANGSPKGRKPAALRTPESLPRRGTSASSHTTTSSTAAPQPSQGHGSKRALGMTRSVSRAPSNAPHSAASKKPFRPPLTRSARPPSTMSQAPSATPSRAAKPAQQRQEDGNDAGADPDSSFDISFDFDPEALEAALKKYD